MWESGASASSSNTTSTSAISKPVTTRSSPSMVSSAELDLEGVELQAPVSAVRSTQLAKCAARFSSNDRLRCRAPRERPSAWRSPIPPCPSTIVPSAAIRIGRQMPNRSTLAPRRAVCAAVAATHLPRRWLEIRGRHHHRFQRRREVVAAGLRRMRADLGQRAAERRDAPATWRRSHRLNPLARSAPSSRVILVDLGKSPRCGPRESRRLDRSKQGLFQPDMSTPYIPRDGDATSNISGKQQTLLVMEARPDRSAPIGQKQSVEILQPMPQMHARGSG